MRYVIGLLLVLGAVGGIDNATDAELIPLIGVAGIGLLLMLR